MLRSIKKPVLLVLLLYGWIPLSFADTSSMNISLSRIQSLLARSDRLANVAAHQQDRHRRVQFHFSRLRGDIHKIQQGIRQQLHQVLTEARMVEPLAGDYLSVVKKQRHIP